MLNQNSDFGIPILEFRFWNSDFGIPTLEFQLQHWAFGDSILEFVFGSSNSRSGTSHARFWNTASGTSFRKSDFVHMGFLTVKEIGTEEVRKRYGRVAGGCIFYGSENGVLVIYRTCTGAPDIPLFRTSFALLSHFFPKGVCVFLRQRK